MFSGDGTLSVCNLRTGKVQSQSEFSEDELLSVVIMKVKIISSSSVSALLDTYLTSDIVSSGLVDFQNGRKVICGTQNGILMLYSWGFFKDCRYAIYL